MTKIFLRVGYVGERPSLQAYDMDALKVMQKWKIGDVVAATVRRPRNIGHHRKWWALLQIIHDGTDVQDKYPRVENLNDAIKLALGYCEQIILPDGAVALKVKSIAFESMAQAEFEDFYERAMGIIVEQLVPHIDREDLEREVERMVR